MKKSALLFTSIAALGAACLTACGGSNHDPYSNLDFSVDLKGTKITMWTPFGAEMHAITEDLVQRWAKATGVEVEIEAKSGYDTLKGAISESASSGTYPNISFAYPDHMASYVGSNILLQLDTYFEKGANTKYDYAKSEPAFKISDFYADYMTENQSVEFKEDGSGYTLGVPFNKSTEVMTVNKTFFEWAHSEDEGIVVPSTWDEVDSIGAKILALLEKRGLYGKFLGVDNVVYDTQKECQDATGKPEKFDFSNVVDPKKVTADTRIKAFHPLGRDSMSNFFITTVRQWGGEYTTLDKKTRQGKILFDSAETKTALEEMQTRYNNNIFGIPSTWGESKYCSNPFSAMKCVMTIGSSAGADSNAPKGGAFDVECKPVFYKSADKKYVISQGTNLILLDKGSNAERVASWELLKYLTKYANGEFAERTGYFPACDYAFNSEEYQDFFNYKPKSMTDQINLSAAKVNRDFYTAADQHWLKFVDAAFDGSSTVRSRVETAVGLLTIGLNGVQQSAQKVIADMVKDLQDYK